jgi:hypothetical protein
MTVAEQDRRYKAEAIEAVIIIDPTRVLHQAIAQVIGLTGITGTTEMTEMIGTTDMTGPTKMTGMSEIRRVVGVTTDEEIPIQTPIQGLRITPRPMVEVEAVAAIIATTTTLKNVPVVPRQDRELTKTTELRHSRQPKVMKLALRPWTWIWTWIQMRLMAQSPSKGLHQTPQLPSAGRVVLSRLRLRILILALQRRTSRY